MMEVKPVVFGRAAFTVYDFPEVGDTLPMHTHGELDAHITIVARGSFRAFGNEWHRTLNSGDIVDWPAHQEHEFVALEPNSRIINMVKGIP